MIDTTSENVVELLNSVDDIEAARTSVPSDRSRNVWTVSMLPRDCCEIVKIDRSAQYLADRIVYAVKCARFIVGAVGKGFILNVTYCT